MNSIRRTLPRLGACAALALAIGLARAEDSAAPAAPAPPAGSTAPAGAGESAGAAGPFTMRIGGGDEAGDHGKGIVITVDGDEDEARAARERAARAAARVREQLETALAGLPAEVRKDLDPHELAELSGALADLQTLRERDAAHADGGSWAGELAAAIVPVTILFLGPVLIVAIVGYNNRRKREMVHRSIDRFVEQGQAVPAQLLEALDKGSANGRTGLQRGSVNVALGVGIGVALYAMSGADAATLGLIPLGIGIAQLVVWAIERKPAAGGPASR